ncbi:sacsin N-terminal ATP-binding-like domain-containing protein [Streptomyces sp. NPDC059740]|uniref:sacsin N-terminal ATP-binding-like domain-containing protein n=1 Tax=Streptomyces sp. NPDC059740 TaxID=3346926 RepID=UPI00364A02CF
MMADPWGTARLRRGVLDAWGASAARFREDANAEEDLALGGYRDRLVVELAQNASDAAARAGVPGRLRLTLTPAEGEEPAVLVASNTGAPLDAAGVESLSTLRASAKRDEAAGTVGRFGVGFAAVLAVSDEPAVVGHGGGVRWSLAEARALTEERVAGSPELAAEVRRRDGHVPLLRLPLPAEGAAPEGYDTSVVLPLRDGAALDLARHLLAGIDDALLLTLPGMSEVVVETEEGTRTLRRGLDGPYVVVDDSAGSRTRWRVAEAAGTLDAALLADRPLEERLRPAWSVTWAVPVDDAGAPAAPATRKVVHAPTPTDEPMGLPALLIASFPLEPTRRHAAPGPLTAYLTERAAECYLTLLREWRPVSTGVLDLVPGPLGPGGVIDAEIRRLVLERAPRVRFLPGAALPEEDEEPYVLRPLDAEVVEGAGQDTVAVLAELLPGLLPAGLERRPELRALGVVRVPLGEVIDRLAGAERPPQWWYRLYDALAGTDPDRLGGLPVPLAGGAAAGREGLPRTTIGPRQVLLPGPGDADRHGALARLGLKVAHPDAVHPLLERLGALPATPRAVLTTPQVRAAVAHSLDEEEDGFDPLDAGFEPADADGEREPLFETVLALVRDAGLGPGDEPWLAALALPDEDGEWAPAGELVLPGSDFERVIREGELARVDQEVATRWGEAPLTAVGVLADFALVRATDVVLDPDELEPRDGDWAEPDDVGVLDSVDVWCEDLLDQLPESAVPPVATEVLAVRDLDLVDDDAWPLALTLLSRPPLRDALTQPVRVLLPDGTSELVRPYTAWWLRGHPVLDGRRPAGLRAAGGDPLLAGLYEAADAGAVDPQVLRALGVRTTLAALLDEPGGAAELLTRLADPGNEVGAAQLHAVHRELAGLDPEEVTLPEEVRAVVDGVVRVVDAAEAVVADAPDLLPLAAGLPLLPVTPARAAELAELLQARRLSEVCAAPVCSEGTEHEVPAEVRELLGPTAPSTYVEHGELLVSGADGQPVEVDWRLPADGVLHASTLEGVAAGLAWAAGAWPRRFEVAALLEDPERGAELARARWFD